MISAIAVGVAPMVIVPLTLLFVLLIIVIAKAPKVGAWIVGGLVLLFPLVVWRFAEAGALRNGEAAPLVVVPATFLFVLMVILLTKMPKVGAGLIVALVVMGALSVPLFTVMSYRRAAQVASVYYDHDELAATVVEQQPWGGRLRVVHPIEPISPTPPAISPIWSEAMEDQFEADVYPSDMAAARALGRRAVEPIRKVAGDPNVTIEVVLFQQGNDRSLVEQFARAMDKGLAGGRHIIEADLRNLRPGEVGLTLRREETTDTIQSWPDGSGQATVTSVKDGRIVATVFTEARRASAEVSYIDKPWVESFAAFADARPGQHYIVARSNETCTSDGEANRQALADARAQLTAELGKRAQWQAPGLPKPEVTEMDVRQGQFVVDKFAQSFAGSAGPIWRQALLIDVSGDKLAKLADLKTHESHQVRLSVARMGLSVVGVLVLIGAIYFFLNMATMGYYVWSLRIAGIVLAVVAVLSVLMIVR